MVAVRASIREVDRGWGELRRAMLEIRRNQLVAKVGVLDSGAGAEERAGGITTAELAAIHEFGAPERGIPERSFVRHTFDAEIENMKALMATLLRKILDGKLTAEQALDIAGLKLATEVKKYITTGEGVPPPNAPATIARKGSDRPLVDTGRLVAAITHEVVRRETVEST